MSKVVKSLAAIALSAVLSGSAYARPSQDPGTDGSRGIGSRLVRVIKHLVKVVLDTGDGLSVPHP